MLFTEYHPGHPSTENKFKIHMVNLSSVNHSKSWARKYSLVMRDNVLHTSILVTLFTGSQLDTWRRIMRLPYIYLTSLFTDNQPTKRRKGCLPHQGLRTQLFSNSGVGVLLSPKRTRCYVKVLWDGTHDFSSFSKKTRKSIYLQMSLQRQHFLLSYSKTLSVGPAGVWTRDLLLSRPALSQLT